MPINEKKGGCKVCFIIVRKPSDRIFNNTRIGIFYEYFRLID